MGNRYEAAKTVLSSKGRGSGVIKRTSDTDKSSRIKKDDLITVFSEKDDSSPKTYKKAREYASELQRETRGLKKGGSTNFIQKAIKKPGALRKQLGAKPGKPIPAKKLAAAAKAPGKLGQRARFAQTLKGFKK